MQRRHFLSFIPQAVALAAAPAMIRPAFAQEGINAKSLTIGCSGALTGPLGSFGQDLKIGVEAAMTQINAKGGIYGRALQLQMLDDGYVPTRTAENVKKMVGESSVFALMSCIGTPNNAAIMPMVEESNMPYLAPLTGATSLRKPSKNVFHVRASYQDETTRLVAKLVDMGIKNLAIVYLDNPFGCKMPTRCWLQTTSRPLLKWPWLPMARICKPPLTKPWPPSLRRCFWQRLALRPRVWWQVSRKFLR
jgi:branched-chain amino acid transport system substrate-binding protein